MFLISFTFPANFIVYGINDYFDLDTDRLNPKKGEKGTEKEILLEKDKRKKTLLLVLFFIILLTTMAGLFAYQEETWMNAVLMVSFLFFSVFYSTPPIRAKARPFLDFLFNVLYIIPGIFAFFSFNESGTGFLSKTDNLVDFLLAVSSAFFWSFGMHLFSAIPDIKPDKQAGIKTTAVFLGAEKSFLLVGIFWMLSFLLSITLSWFFAFLVLYPVLIFWMIKNPVRLVSKNYKYFPKINLITGFIIFWICVSLIY